MSQQLLGWSQGWEASKCLRACVLCLCVEVMGHHWVSPSVAPLQPCFWTRVSLSPELIPSARLSCLRAQWTLWSPELESLRSASCLAAFPGGLAPEAPGLTLRFSLWSLVFFTGSWRGKCGGVCNYGAVASPAVSTLIFTSCPVAPTRVDKD